MEEAGRRGRGRRWKEKGRENTGEGEEEEGRVDEAAPVKGDRLGELLLPRALGQGRRLAVEVELLGYAVHCRLPCIVA